MVYSPCARAMVRRKNMIGNKEDTTMKKNILSLAALLIASAAVFTACSSDDNISSEQPANPTGKYIMTVQASKGDDATTRALTLDGKTLNATWDANEKVLVYQGGSQIGTLYSAASSTNATTLTGELNSAPNAAQNLTLYFHTNATPSYAGQDGTLAKIASTYDFCAPATITAGSFTVSGSTVSTNSSASFGANQQAIVKFTLIDKADGTTSLNASQLVINDGTTDYTISPTSPTSEIYAAIPGFTGQTVTLTATVGDDTYAYEKTGVTFENGQYYEVKVKMHEYVDLGLSVKWATMNVGAESVTDRGLYFAWGETTGHAFGSGYKFSLDNYAWYNDGVTGKYTKYKHDGSSWDYEVLESGDDAATRNWGGMWRMPTKAEWEELLNEDNCTWTWTTDYKGDGSNVAGVIVTSKKDGYTDKSIFLPATGIYNGNKNTGPNIYANYWSKSLYTNNRGTDLEPLYYYHYAWKLEILYDNGSLSWRRVQNENRYYGIGVRAVRP